MSNISMLAGKARLTKVAVGLLSFSLLATAPVAILADTTTTNSATHVAGGEMWNFHDADIHAIIQMVAKLTGKNFVVDPRVQGKVSLVSSHPMSKDECYKSFLSMLQLLNYSAVPSGDVIKIVPSLNAKSEGLPIATDANPGSGEEMVVRIVPVVNTQASQLVPILQPLKHDYGSIDAYTPSNSLILSGEADNINNLVKIIKKLDAQNISNVQMVALKHATADKLASAITQLQSQERGQGQISNVSVVADAQSNSLLVSGTSTNRDQVIQLIHRLDKADGAAVGQGAEVIHLNYLTAKDIAPTLTKMVGGGAKGSTAQNVTIEPEEANNALIINAPIGVRQNIEKVIKQLDVRPKQVMVEAIIAEVDQKLVSNLGVQWGASSGTTESGDSSGFTGVISSGAIGSLLGGGIHVSGNTTSGSVDVSSGGMSAIVSALRTDGNSTILATPMTMVLNNQQAKISAVQSISVTNREYPDFDQNGSNSNSSNNSFDNNIYQTTQYQDLPLSLQVTPQISPNNTVRLKVDQEDDSVGSTNGQGNNPDLNKNSLTTDVLVKSGDTLVMGGLIQNTRSGSVAKVPLLGDIPLLGNLFKNRSKSNRKQDLMIFIRPVIVSSDADGEKVTSAKYNYIRGEQIKRALGQNTMSASSEVLPDTFDTTNKVKLPPPFPMASK